MAPKGQVRLDFDDESKRAVLLVRREGQATGQGPLAGATVTGHGMHDVVPACPGNAAGYLAFSTTRGSARAGRSGMSGNAGGYLAFSRPDGLKACVRWSDGDLLRLARAAR